MSSTISIIIATYNAEQYLRYCLDSIIPQLNENIELIIIDGGSKDNTVEIIKHYSQSVKYSVSERDQGIYDAWNKGIQKARGEWIMFIGADDTLIKGSIAEIVSFIKETDVSKIDYISAKNIYTDENGEFLKLMGEKYSWDKMRKGMCVAHVASLHNRKLFDEIGLYSLEYKICADYELLLRKRDKLKTLFINKEIAKMQIGGMSFTSKALKEVFKIRGAHSTQLIFNNSILFIKDLLLFYTFRSRKKLLKIFGNGRKA